MLLMIKLVDIAGETWNINLEDISTVDYSDPLLPIDRQRDTITMRNTSQVISAAPGTFLAAVAALFAEFPMGPNKPADNVFIGTTP